MNPNKTYDILFLVDTGIGNAIEVLYAVEYCLANRVRAGIFLGGISASFTAYLRDSYGSEIVVPSLDGLTATHLVHSWLYEGKIPVRYSNYFHVEANRQSTEYRSETEQYLDIVRALYPSSYEGGTLTQLKENYSDRVKALQVEQKFVLYPGCDARTPSKRWPYFEELIAELGAEKVVVVGGGDDLNYRYSYFYPKWLTRICPGYLLRKIRFFNLMKSAGLLRAHAHGTRLKGQPYSHFNVFNWPELTALLRRARHFIGNDGGLTQLAGACGAQGLVLFGPSSVAKNRPYQRTLRPLTIAQALDCQPCQFRVNGTDAMSKNSILCPFQVRCLYSIRADLVAKAVTGSLPEPSVDVPRL